MKYLRSKFSYQPICNADEGGMELMDEKRLVPITLDLLYDGMVIPYDIYDANRKYFLLKQGNTIKASQIESIKNINNGEDTIYVTVETFKMLLEHYLKIRIHTWEDLEKNSGYTVMKNEVNTLLQNFKKPDDITTEKLTEISDMVTEQLDSPEIIADLVTAAAPDGEYLQRHSLNVGLLNGLIGRWLGLPKEAVDAVVMAGILHDCGMVCMPSPVLDAPRPLTVVEYEMIKMHTVRGYDILNDVSESVRLGVRNHHESYNGGGYPDRLNGLNIPLTARITAVSDVYDAITSHKNYRLPKDPFSAMAYVKNLKDSRLDPTSADAFLMNMTKLLTNKPVQLSTGEISVVHKIDPDNLAYPIVKLGKREIRCNKKIYCQSVYMERKSPLIW